MGLIGDCRGLKFAQSKRRLRGFSVGLLVAREKNTSHCCCGYLQTASASLRLFIATLTHFFPELFIAQARCDYLSCRMDEDFKRYRFKLICSYGGAKIVAG
jgi:hypothetical protein